MWKMKDLLKYIDQYGEGLAKLCEAMTYFAETNKN